MTRWAAVTAACWLLAGTVGRGEIVLHGGAGDVVVDVDFAWAPGAARPDGDWREDGRDRVLTRRTENGIAAIRIGPGDGAVRIEAALTYDRPAAVDHETLRLRLPGPARVLGHDLRLVPLAGTVRVERGTPILLVTPAVLLTGGSGFVAARYTPRDGHVDVELVLDDRAAHPFAAYDRCLDRLPSPPDWAALERRHPLDRMRREAGTRVSAAADLYVLGGLAEPLPLVVERWPAGADAAIVFTDHADRTDPDALRAVLYGSADPGAVQRPRGGFVGHGLQFTKTFFAQDARGGLATDRAARALADALVAAGSEVGNHSPTPHADRRDVVRAGLDALAPWHPITWIDHEPYTNCEAVSSEGSGTVDPFGIRDLLALRGYRWVWAATDEKSGGLDLFAADSPVVFPLPADPRLWVFRSSWFSAPPSTLAHTLSDAALDALEHARGLAVLHAYLSASAATTPSAEHRRALVVRHAADGTLELDPVFDAMLARLAARARRGELVVAPWREIGDRLRGLGALVVHYGRDGTAVIENRGDDTLAALTVAVAAPDAELDVDGAVRLGRRADGERARVWFDLPAGGRVGVRARRGGTSAPFLAPADVLVEVR